MKTLPPTEPDNALIVGQSVHTGIEKSLEEAIKEYCFSYPIITNEHINEIIKLEKVIPLAKETIPPGGEFEVEISDNDFHGFIDYLVPVGYDCSELTDKDAICNECKTYSQCAYSYSGECPYGNYSSLEADWFDIYDFKYSNNVSGYKDSEQLHLYKYFFERNNPGKKIRNLYFLFVPKINIRQKKAESLRDFRKRLISELSSVKISKVQIEFNYQKVIEFLLSIKAANEETEFPPNKSYLCEYCEFQEFCEKGNDYMIKLPENKRIPVEEVGKRAIWIYGVPFCGKTTFANEFPDPLMLNTDGNIKFLNPCPPFIHIKDEVKVEGRQTKRTLAWEMFKDVITELEKKDNTFKTIVVDLLEDLYEHCRLYMYQQMGITHESDDSFRAWDKVRSEFLNTLKRLMNLDYENIILISHEDTSKDITRKGGDKITAIKPNLQEKVATKVAGMVDVVARIVADGDIRTFSFKSNEVIFGGGRLRVSEKDIPLDVNALFTIYDEANKNAASGFKPAPAVTSSRRRKAATEMAQNEPEAEQAANDTSTPEKSQEEANTAVSETETPTNALTGDNVKEDGSTENVTNANNSPSESTAEGKTETNVEATEETPRRKRRARA